MKRDGSETNSKYSPYSTTFATTILASIQDTLISVNRDKKNRLKENETMVHKLLKATQEKEARKAIIEAKLKADYEARENEIKERMKIIGDIKNVQ